MGMEVDYWFFRPTDDAADRASAVGEDISYGNPTTGLTALDMDRLRADAFKLYPGLEPCENGDGDPMPYCLAVDLPDYETYVTIDIRQHYVQVTLEGDGARAMSDLAKLLMRDHGLGVYIDPTFVPPTEWAEFEYNESEEALLKAFEDASVAKAWEAHPKDAKARLAFMQKFYNSPEAEALMDELRTKANSKP